MINDQQEKTSTCISSDITKFTQTFETKLENRFIFYIKSISDNSVLFPTFTIKSICRPKISKMDALWIWESIHITFYDLIIPSVPQMLYTYINTPNQLFNITLNLLGPVGDVVESWDIKNAEFTYIDFGNLDWSNSGSILEIHTMLKFEKAILNY
jgi:hypothetical protein